MPYRRLPNTDQARIRALKSAVLHSDAQRNVDDLPISLKTLGEARMFLSKFEIAQGYYKSCYEEQANASRKHQVNVKMARLYISHFIQVLNMSVIRSEIKASQKTLYGLVADDYSVPDLISETAMAEWGQRLIKGELLRTSQGGSPIYNPAIAKVKVHYDVFMVGYEKQKGLQSLTNRSLEDLAAMRTRADELILDIWNQVEAKFQEVVPNEKRLDLCRAYGVIYYYRKGEKKEEENL